MIMLIAFIVVLIISLLVLIKSANLFVDNLVEIGESLGVSHIILGVTASAIGTSLPEFGSAMIAILTGSSDIGVGVVIGSNIWNIAGILGISAFVAGVIHTNRQEMTRDGVMTLLTALILTAFMFLVDEITAVMGVVLIIIYAGYLWILIRSERNNNKNNEKKIEKGKISRKTILMALIGITGLIIGARILVYSGVEIARIANIPEMLIGLFALAIGTSMPELVVTLTSAMKKLHSLSFGTVLGSNVFNIMIGLGVPALFMNIPIEPLSISFDAPVMIFVTALLLLLAGRKMKLTRYAGLILMITYVVYIVTRIFITI
jgi:cation:H+ antiporter